MRRAVLLVSCCLVSAVLASAKDDDTRNVMLNAETATVPREINIGLPDSGNGAVVFIDGMKHAQGLPRGHYHWAGGHAYEPVGTMDLMEAVIRAGEFGVLVDSRTRFGGSVLSGAVTVSTSTNGLLRLDGALGGPVRGLPGWSFSLGAYVNLDPTPVNSPSRTFVDNKQIVQAALTRRWGGDAALSLLYRLSSCRDRVDGGYSVAPFIYAGDGSIRSYGGFRLGRDCYMPADETVRWMDLATGTWREGDMSRMDRRVLHDIEVLWNHRDLGGWAVDASWHLCLMPAARFLKVGLAGIDRVDAAAGVTTPDGRPFAGLVQNRLVTVEDMDTADAEGLFQATRTMGRHIVKAGLSLVYADQYEAGSTFQFAHTVTVSPQRLFQGGASTWNMNRSALYFEAWRVSAALFAFDDWAPVPRLLVRTGVRVKPLYNHILTAARLDGETVNTRVDGFNLADPTLCNRHLFQGGDCDYAVSEHLRWRVSDHLSAMGEGFYSMTNKATTYYKNATLPSLKPIGNALVRGGAAYEADGFDCTALVSYITSWNNALVMTVTKQVGGVSETIPWTAQYGIGTLGFTVDANLRRGGFRLHARATWQDPAYKDYRNAFTFSDGSLTVIDYTGNCVTGISRLMLELDPSWAAGRWRVWGSARYYDRQYVSRTNLAWFSGHFETFAGADFRLDGRNSLSLNLVNLLLQRGAKGSIDIADTIEDVSLLEGYVMAGSYIRPFTAEIGYTFKF